MAESAEITAETVNAVVFTPVADKAFTFAIPADMNTLPSQLLFGNLADQKLTAAFAGAMNIENEETPEEQRERKHRECLSLLWIQFEIDEMIREIQEEIRALEQKVAELQERIATLKDDSIQLLARIETMQKNDLAANDKARKAIQASYENYCTGLSDILGENKLTIEDLKDAEQDFITVRADLPGLDGPRRYIVFEDAAGEYYIKHPESGENLYVDALAQPQMRLQGDDLEGKSFTMQDDIALQKSWPGRRFGNERSPTQIEWFYDVQDELFKALESLEDNDVRDRIIGFRDTLRYQEIALFKLDREREQIVEEIKALERRERENTANISAMEAQISQYHNQIAALQERLADLNMRRDEIKRQAEETLQYTEETRAQIRELFEKATQMAEQESAPDDQIRTALEKMDTSEGDSLTAIAMQMFTARRTVKDQEHTQDELTAAAKHIDAIASAFPDRYTFLLETFGIQGAIEKVWEDPIRLPNGQGVYHDGVTGEFYTYDPQTERRTYITDPIKIAKIMEDAYIDGKLFMNEAWAGEDPENGMGLTFATGFREHGLLRIFNDAQNTAGLNLKVAQKAAEKLTEETGITFIPPAARDEKAGALAEAYNKDTAPAKPAPETKITVQKQDLDATPSPKDAS